MVPANQKDAEKKSGNYLESNFVLIRFCGRVGLKRPQCRGVERLMVLKPLKIYVEGRNRTGTVLSTEGF